MPEPRDPLSDQPVGTVWICLGETDEWHPFCPFATRHEAKAMEHTTHPGHWCEIDTDGLSRSGLWGECLAAEDRAAHASDETKVSDA